MKTKFFTLFIAALSFSSISFAKLLRVGYVGPLVNGVDFADAQAAHDAASDGDTLQFYPGSTGAGNYTISTYNKRLVLIGNGYFINDPNLVNNTNLNMVLGTVTIYIDPVPSSTGSDGTILEGFNTASVQSEYDNTTLNNIIITRCNYAYFSSNDGQINTLKDCKMTECYNANLNFSGNTATLTNFRIENSFFGGYISAINPASTILINNCISQGANFNDNNIVVQNSILINTSSVSGVSNTVFNNNIFSGQPTVSGANNQFNVNIANVFVGYSDQGSYSEDARWQLTATSPAKGVGIGGVDLGPFGGPNPYRLSGIPPIPAIYKLQAASPNATTNPYPITVSVRSNN